MASSFIVIFASVLTMGLAEQKQIMRRSIEPEIDQHVILPKDGTYSSMLQDQIRVEPKAVAMVGLANRVNAHDVPRARNNSIKLVVNSDTRYHVALETLFKSMEGVLFQRWHDVIVMRGSAAADSEPYTPDTAYGKRGVTFIDLKLSSFDFHGYSGLYHNRNHALVQADVYLYIHDTVKVNSTFPSKFDSLASIEHDEVQHPPYPFSNICAFGSGVVKRYGENFDTPVTKDDAIRIEFGKAAAGVHNVAYFAKKDTTTQGRESLGREDLYNTGIPRSGSYYPAFGLTKYLLSGKHGDLLGDVHANGNVSAIIANLQVGSIVDSSKDVRMWADPARA